jgi:hypothetical protein
LSLRHLDVGREHRGNLLTLDFINKGCTVKYTEEEEEEEVGNTYGYIYIYKAEPPSP